MSGVLFNCGFYGTSGDSCVSHDYFGQSKRSLSRAVASLEFPSVLYPGSCSPAKQMLQGATSPATFLATGRRRDGVPWKGRGGL